MIFPSLKDKIRTFEDQAQSREGQEKSIMGGQTSTFVKRVELEKIIEIETKRRNYS